MTRTKSPKRRHKKPKPGSATNGKARKRGGSSMASQPTDQTKKEKKHQRKRRTLNWPLALATLAVFAIVAPSAWFLHEYQVNRTADVFLNRAAQLENEGDWSKSAAYIRNYLRLHPDDTSQRVRLAEVFGKSVADRPANTAAAVSLYRRAITDTTDESKRRGLRRKMVALLIDLRRFKDAEAEILRQPRLKQPDAMGRRLLAAPEDRRLFARTLYGRYQIGAIDGPFKVATELQGEAKTTWTLSEVYRQALELNPDDPELAVTLAELLRSHPALLTEKEKERARDDRVKQADQLVADLLAKAPKNPKVLLAVYLYGVRYKLPDADKHLDTALKLAPKNVDILFAAARRARRKGNELVVAASKEKKAAKTTEPKEQPALNPLPATEIPDDAAKQFALAGDYYRRIISEQSDNETAYLELGLALLAKNKTDEAVKAWEEGLKALGRPSVPILTSLADVLIGIRRYDDAAARLDELDAAIDPTRWSSNLRESVRCTSRLLRGRLALAQQKPADAIRQLRLSTVGLKDTADDTRTAIVANLLLASAYGQLDQWDLAAMAYEQVVQRQSGAAAMPARIAAAAAWRRAGQPQLAADHYRIVLAVRDLPEIWLRLAETLLDQQALRAPGTRQWADALQALGRARPSNADQKTALRDPWRADLLFVRYVVMRIAGLSDAAEKDALRDQAIRRLGELESEDKKSAQILARLAMMYQQLDRQDAADRVVAEYEKIVPSQTDTTLLKIQLLLMRKQREQARQVVLDQIVKAPEADKQRLRAALARINMLDGKTANLAEVYDQKHPNTRILFQMAEQALANKDLKRAEKWETELKRIEGESGSRWQNIRARRLLLGILQDKADKTDPRFDQVVRIQKYLVRERPYWAPGFLLKATIAQIQGDLDGTIDAYRRAIELGERRVVVFEQLARLMWTAGRADLDQVLARLGSRVESTPDLSAISIFNAARQGDLTQATQRARLGVQNRPKDPLAHLWLGSVLLANNQPDDGEQEIQRATQLAPTDLRTWKALFTFYVRTGKKDQARTAMDKLGQKVKFKSDAARQFVLAGFERQLGDHAAAGKRMARALSLAKDTKLKIAILVQDAQLDLKAGKVDDAVKKLEQAHRQSPTEPKVRQTLAAALAARGKEGDFQRALTLLPDSPDSAAHDATADRRLRGMLLATRADANYRENVAAAVKIFESLVQSQPPAPGDRIYLARLYTIQSQIEPPDSVPASDVVKFRKSRLDAAKKQLFQLISFGRPDPRHIAQYIGFLLLTGQRDQAPQWLGRLKDAVMRGEGTEVSRLVSYAGVLLRFDFRDRARATLAELEQQMTGGKSPPSTSDIGKFIRLCLQLKTPDKANRWIAELKRQQPDKLGTLQLETRWLHAQQKDAEISRLVEDFVKSHLTGLKSTPERNGFYLTIGNLFSAAKLDKEATPWYQRLTEAVPGGYRPLAVCLARQQRIDDVFQVCRKAESSISKARVAATLADVCVATDGISPADLQRADRLATEVMNQSPDDRELIMAVANLRAKQQRVAAAIGLYQKVLALNPRDAVAMNNLATLLSELSNQTDEALRYIDRAVVYSGIQAALLDTKGSVLLSAGRDEDAISILRGACWAADTDPRHWFHLAIALDRTGQVKEAAKALQKSLADDLEKQLLTPSDRSHLARLRKKYATSAAL